MALHVGSVNTRPVELTNPDRSCDSLMREFDVDELPDVYNAPVPYRGYVFVTAPSMYLFEDANNVRAAIKKIPDMYPLLTDTVGVRVGQSLSDLRSSTAVYGQKSVYLPYITQRAKSFPVSSETLRSIDKQGTYYGHVVRYPRFSEDHRKAGSVSIDFVNDRFLTIARMAAIWTKYIQYVTRSSMLRPRATSVYGKELDMLGSMYYIVTKMDGSEIVYWEKKIGIFPTETSSDFFSMSSKEVQLADSISLSFDYSFGSKPYDLNVLADLNILTSSLCGGSVEFVNQSHYDNYQFARAKGPFITTNPTTGKHYLRWAK